MADITNRGEKRRARHDRIRRKLAGTAERPRLAVFKSARQIYVQAIDDVEGRTLVSASSLDKGFRKELEGLKPTEAAGRVGKVIAERCKEKGLQQVVFDRGGFPYKGRIKALADAAREAGLDF